MLYASSLTSLYHDQSSDDTWTRATIFPNRICLIAGCRLDYQANSRSSIFRLDSIFVSFDVRFPFLVICADSITKTDFYSCLRPDIPHSTEVLMRSCYRQCEATPSSKDLQHSGVKVLAPP